MPRPAAALRVGYVVKRFPRASETFVAHEVLELERRGVQVHVFALRSGDELPRHEWLRRIRAEVTRCGPGLFSDTWNELQRLSCASPSRRERLESALLAAFRHSGAGGRRSLGEALLIAHEARRLGIEHLHAHFANVPAFTAMLAHLIVGIPYSFTAHAKDIYAAGPPADLWRLQLRLARFAVTVAEANRRHLVRALGQVAGDKIRRLYNGVDLEAIRPAPRAAREDPPRAVCVARLVEKKGVDVLLEALRRARGRSRAPLCEVVGDGPEAEPLRRQAAESGLGGSVRFVGSLPHERVIARMMESDLFILPCRVAADGDRDALPTVLLEAMAAGLPCISTRVGGVPEIIEDGVTGLLVPPEDPAALAAAVMRLAADSGLRRRMGDAGRRRAEARFDLKASVATLHGWFGHQADAAAAARGARRAARAAGRA